MFHQQLEVSHNLDTCWDPCSGVLGPCKEAGLLKAMERPLNLSYINHVSQWLTVCFRRGLVNLCLNAAAVPEFWR